MSKLKIGDFSLNNLDKPVVQLDAQDGTVKCRYVVHLEIDDIVYVVDRDDKLAVGLFTDAECGGWDPERWKESIRQEIKSLEQDLSDIGNLETRGADDLREKIEYLQRLEYEYPEGILEQLPWRSGKIKISHGNTEKVMSTDEFKQQHNIIRRSKNESVFKSTLNFFRAMFSWVR